MATTEKVPAQLDPAEVKAELLAKYPPKVADRKSVV